MSEQWKAEATEVIVRWDRCFDALPEDWKAKSLGRLKSDVVLGYIEHMTDPNR